MPDNSTITNVEIENFKNLIADPARRNAFVSEDPEKATLFLQKLSEYGPQAQALVVDFLSSGENIAMLASPFTTQSYKCGKHIMNIIETATPEQQARMLSAPWAIEELSESDQTKNIAKIFNATPHEEQIKILSAHGALSNLALYHNKWAQGLIMYNMEENKRLINIFKTATQEQQVDILAAEDAIPTLLSMGQGRLIMQIIETASSEQQARILASDTAIRALDDAGYSKRIGAIQGKIGSTVPAEPATP
jgi:hypothetical protein